MTIMQLNSFLNRTVRIDYTTKTIPHSRVGFVYAVSTRKMILLVFPGDKEAEAPTVLNPWPQDENEEEFEIYCPMKTITNIKELKGA